MASREDYAPSAGAATSEQLALPQPIERGCNRLPCAAKGDAELALRSAVVDEPVPRGVRYDRRLVRQRYAPAHRHLRYEPRQRARHGDNRCAPAEQLEDESGELADGDILA